MNLTLSEEQILIKAKKYLESVLLKKKRYNRRKFFSLP